MSADARVDVQFIFDAQDALRVLEDQVAALDALAEQAGWSGLTETGDQT